MDKFLIDSDVIIWFLRNREETVNLLHNLKKSGVPACSAISVVEVQLGVKKGEEEITADVLDSLKVFSVDKQVAQKAGEIIRKKRQKEVSVNVNDAIIAATCILHNLTLVTYNIKHYPFKEFELYPAR